MSRALPLVALALLGGVGACSFDARGLRSDEALGPGDDATAELDTSVVEDSSVAPEDSSAPDTKVPDTAVVDSAAPDTAVVDTAPVDAGPPPFCNPADTTLIGCWEFEDSGKDGSSYKHDLTITGSAFVKGGVVGKALDVGPGGKATTPNDLNWVLLNQLTVEMWVNLKSLPTGSNRMGLIDSEARFGLFLVAPGVLHATMPTAFALTAPLTTKTWTHVAYTYDGLTMTLYVNGAAAGTKAVIDVFGAGATLDPVTVGMNSPSGDVLDGVIDQMRVYKAARTAKQICAAAGTC